MTAVTGLLVLVGWFGVGRVMVRRLGVESLIGESLLAVALGAGVHSTVQAVGLLARAPAAAPLLAVALAGALALARDRAALGADVRAGLSALRETTRLERLLLVALAGLLALRVLTAFAPPTSFDALCYHLPEVESYARTASLEPIPHVSQTYYPKGVEVLFAGAYALGGATAAQLVHALFGVALVLAVAVIAGRLIGRVAGLGAGLLMLAFRDVLSQFGTANVDLAFGFFQIAALGTLPAVFGAGGRRAAALTGVLAGLGVAAKLLGAGLVGVLVVVVAAVRGARRRWAEGLIGAALLGAFALFVYLPWFARARLELGTFAYPLVPARVEVAGRTPGVGAGLRSELGRAGDIYAPVRESPLPLALWTLTFAQSIYKKPVTPLVPALVPVALFLLAVQWRGRRSLALLTLVALLAAAFWFKTYPVVRYVLGPLGVLTVGMVLAIDWLARGGYVGRIVVVGLVTIVAGLEWTKGASAALSAAQAVVSPGLRTAYVDREVHTAPAMRRVLAETGPDPKLLSTDPRVFLLGRNAESAGDWNFAWKDPRDAAELGAWIRARGLEWVAFFPAKAGAIPPGLLRELCFVGALEARYEDDDGALYRVISANSSE